MVTVNEVLENSKDKFDQVVVIGIKNGEIDINTNTPAFPLIHYLINRAAFKLNVYEDRELAILRAKKEAEVKEVKEEIAEISNNLEALKEDTPTQDVLILD